MRVRDSVYEYRSANRPRGGWLLPAAAFLIASCGRAPEVGRALDATPIAVAAPAALASPPDTTGYRTAFDLIANRVHAVSHRDGRLVVDAGAIDFLKYVDGGWKTSWLLGEKDEGKPASLVNGLGALAFLPVDTDGDGAGGSALGPATLSVTMRALAPAQKVSVFINEKPAGTLDVANGKKRYDVAVPADLLHAGDNRVRLQFKSAANVAGGKRSAAAIQQLALGPAGLGAVPADLAVVETREVTVGGVARRALVPGGHGSRISYYVQLPVGAHLALGVGGEGTQAGGTALVRVAVDGQPARTLHEGPSQHAGTICCSTAARRLDTRCVSTWSRAAERSPGRSRGWW